MTKVNEGTIAKAVKIAGDLMKVAKNEFSLQQMIERYQKANATANYSLDAVIMRLELYKARAQKAENQFANLIDPKTGEKIVSRANWQPFADLFNRSLSHLKESTFLLEAKISSAKDIQKAGISVVTPSQAEVITEYHENRARAQWERVSQYREILVIKGLLKETKKEVPTKKELQTA